MAITKVKVESLYNDGTVNSHEYTREEYIKNGDPEFKVFRESFLRFMEVTGDESVTFTHETYIANYTFTREK
jgi:hypothetical protein